MIGSPTRPPAGDPTRTGYVTIVGLPNVGKSALLNALVGEKLSIVTPMAQTTWQRVIGIHTTPGAQMIFLDTPGLLEANDLFQRSMLAEALQALCEADVTLLVVDACLSLEERGAARLTEAVTRSSATRIVAVNKVDVAPGHRTAEWSAWARRALDAQVFATSALHRTGIENLRERLTAALPAGPFLYPADEIASQPVRFFVAELVRETVFERYVQEIPYSVCCRVDELREDQEPCYVAVSVFVERKSQKGVLVGRGGTAVRELGRSAREKIEHFLGRPVYLDLWVKTLEGWRRRKSELTRLGFRVPDDPP